MTSVVWNTAELHELLQSPRGPVARMLARKCVRVESRAKGLCPVDTGRLRSSITYRVGDAAGEDEFVQGGTVLNRMGAFGTTAGPPPRPTDLVAVVGTNVEYAFYVEMGTRYTRDQPFLVPALDAARD